MKTRIFLSILTIATCFIFSTHLNATIKGSEAAISVEPYYDFLSTETDNSMLGFGWFKNGFGLEDSSTTCTFESIFPVSGDVYLNGGFLHLNSDLLFRNMMTWHTPGTIVANDYVVDFSSSVTTLGNTSNFQVFDNSIVNINSDLIISGSVKFSGNCLFNGNGKRVLLGDNGYLLIDENTTVTFKDIYIDGITEGKISCLADSSNLVLDDVRWIQDGDYSFTNGSFKIFNQVDFTGSYTFSYESGQTSTIHKNSRLVVVDELVFVVGRKESQDYVEPLCFQDETSILKLHDCSLIISDSGMCLTRGTVVVEGDVFLDIHSSTTQNGFVLGDGTEQGDMKLKFNPGSAMHYLSGHLVDNVTDPGFLSPKQENARLIRYANTVFHLQQNINIANLIVDSDLLSQMVVDAGKTVSYTKAFVQTVYADFWLTGFYGNDYCNFLMGNSDLCMKKGILPAYTYIWNSNNTIRGNGDISGVIALQNSAAQARFNLNGSVLTDVVMNGGSILLDGDLNLAYDTLLSGSGNVNLDNKTLVLGTKDLIWTSSIYWDGDEGQIELNSNISLSSTWTFSGTTIIDGHWNVLILKPGADIVVEKGSTLIFKETKIKNLSGTRIRCLDEHSTIKFNNAKTRLSGDFTFMQGKFEVSELLEVHDTYTFDYQSCQQSVVGPCSDFIMMEGSTFKYNPACANRDLLKLQCVGASKFILDNSNLHSTTTGLQLTVGVLQLNGDCVFSSEATILEEGIRLGDGISAANNLDVDVMPNADFEIASGYVVDKNVVE